MNVFQRARMEDRVVLHDVSWQTYEAFLADPEVGHLRLTYDHGTLELCARLCSHERTRVVLRLLLVQAMCRWGIEANSAGLITFKREDLQCGLEPDDSIYVENRKRVSKHTGIELPRDPPPDLAIEVDIIGSCLDRSAIYAALGIPELWRSDGESIRVYRLRPGVTYELCERSPTFPALPLEGMAAALRQRFDEGDGELMRSFATWLNQESLPDRVVNHQ